MTYHNKKSFPIKYLSLINYLKDLKKLAIAYSGGQDSTLLLIAAKEALNNNIIAFTINAPYIPKWEIEEAREITEEYSIEHQVIDLPVIDSIKYNPDDRCYLCKKNIFVRGIDEEVFLKFKSKTVVMKKTLGEAFNDAMVLWLKTNSK